MLGNIFQQKEGDKVIIKVTGEFDSRLVKNFENLTEELLRTGERQFIIDLSECQFIYSVGIGKIVAFLKKLEEVPDSSLKLRNCIPRIRKLFELVRLDNLFEDC